MRPILLAVLALAAAPAAVAAQERVELEVGEVRRGLGTVRPICDAPSVAIIEGGVLKAIGPGETLCSVASVQAQGTRQVYRVIVRPKDPPRATEGEGKPAER